MADAWSAVFDAHVPKAEAGSGYKKPKHDYSPSTNTIGYGHFLVEGGSLVQLLLNRGVFQTASAAIDGIRKSGITDELAWTIYSMDKAAAANRLLSSVGPVRLATPEQLSALVELCYIRGYLTEINTPGLTQCVDEAGFSPAKLGSLLLTADAPAVQRFRKGLNYPRSPRLARICAQLRGVA